MAEIAAYICVNNHNLFIYLVARLIWFETLQYTFKLNRVILMAPNFSCFINETSDSLHLKLYGDFDGDSAYQLINSIKNKGKNFLNVFIDTNDLNRVYPFGISVFEKKVRTIFKKKNTLIFIGKNKSAFLINVY